MSKTKKPTSQVFSIRLSNKDLAGCLEFEELLKQTPSDKLSSCVVLLVKSTLSLLRESGKIHSLSEVEAEEILEEFLKRTSRTAIGKKEVMKRAAVIESGIKDAFAPQNFICLERRRKENVELPLLHNASDTNTSSSDSSSNSNSSSFHVSEGDRGEDEAIKEFHSQIEEEVEVIKAQDELALLKSIFINPNKKEV